MTTPAPPADGLTQQDLNDLREALQSSAAALEETPTDHADTRERARREEVAEAPTYEAAYAQLAAAVPEGRRMAYVRSLADDAAIHRS
ncbi:hypothetical protein [Nocardioides bruguierae]|uniref:hypothetical protein n=1 Tax=Nocardioides bruguierae TaxID=2945102 RepID=UPI002021FF47|nr:hypothetical protein [Nocardioides bruguierae]MCL8026018.1 hypothetical protein [Nocardioides bruguierae]